jgi:biotin operon repressor
MTANKRPIGQTRELVRKLDADGLSRNQIAAALGVSNQAVGKHIKNIRRDQVKDESAA